MAVDEIYRRLKALDPVEASRQNSGNRRHLSRALEICLITGGKASDLRQNFADASLVEDLEGIVLNWPREILAERIKLRTSLMMKGGVIEEVKRLSPEAETIRQAIGVREIEAYLRGEMSVEECEEKIMISTRQYAKRQRNWFRRESWLRPLDGELEVGDLVSEVEALFCG